MLLADLLIAKVPSRTLTNFGDCRDLTVNKRASCRSPRFQDPIQDPPGGALVVGGELRRFWQVLV